ncbi:MAG: hypothetical protein KY475_01780 [Planctomycetes bacterium]|nr:hypothetical protein [Planctomycetota bacterium]
MVAEKALPPAITFRRVYVPEDRVLEAAPRGFYPFVRAEFEHLAGLLQQQASAPAEVQGASFRRAEYYAALDADGNLRGRAALEIARHRPGAAATALSPLNLAIQAPFWRTSGALASTGRDEDGRFIALVRSERVLEFSWSRSGAEDAFGAIGFPLELPPALVRVLSLDLPQGMQLEADGGIGEEIGNAASPPGDLLELPPADPGLRRWRVQLGGGAGVELRITPREDEETSAVDVRPSLIYTVAPQAAALNGEFRLDVRGRPIRELVLSLDEGVKLTSARLQDDALLVRASPEAPSRVTLQFPEPIGGSGHSLHFTAQAPTMLNQPWRLPRIRAVGATWRSGQTELHLAEMLTVDSLDLVECVQTQAGPPAAGKTGRTLSFRDYSTNAEVTITAARETLRVHAVAGASVDLGPVSAAMTTVFLLRATQGQRFSLAADVAREWIVDSVAATTLDSPPQDIQESVDIPPPGSDGAPLQVRLSQSLNPDRPVRLVIRAHRRLLGEGDALTMQDLRAITLRDVEETSRYAAVEPDSPYQAALAGDGELVRLDPNKLPAEAASVVAASSASVVFQDTGVSGGVRIFLTRATPNFSAEIAMTASADEAAVREEYRIRVAPTSSRVEEVRVHFSRRRDSEVAWEMVDAPEQSVAARRLESDEAEEGETWELRFARPRDAAFELLGKRTSDFAAPLPLAFASLPQANAQKGELIVESAPGAAVKLQAGSLDPSPVPPPAPDKYSTIIGAYRYEPTQQPAATLERSPPGAGAADAWVWKLQLQSAYPLEGEPRHMAVLHVENRGRPSLELTLPRGAQLRRLDVAGEAMSPAPPPRDGVVKVALPPGVRVPEIEVEYLDASQPWGLAQTVEPRAPAVDAAVLSREWTVRLPQGASLASEFVLDERSKTAWDVRLLGPLRGKRPMDATGEPVRGGWIAHGVAWSSPDVNVVVYRTDVLGAMAAGLFLVSAAVLSWVAAGRMGWLWLVAAASAVAALAAPAPWFVFCTAIFLSAPCAAAMGLAAHRKRRTDAAPQEDGESSLSLSVAARVVLAVLLAGGAVYGRLAAADPAAVHPVIIPIDEEGRVSTRDKYVYLPESLYAALRQAARGLEAPPRDWLLRSANYRAAFGWNLSGDEIDCRRIDAELELEILSAPCTVVLPAPWRDAGLAEDSLRMDGAPPEWSWSDDPAGLQLDFSEAGLYRLELTFTPIITEANDQRRVSLPVPATPDAELKVVYPADGAGLLLPTALGGVQRNDSTQEITAQLGPVDNLTMLWPNTVEAAPGDERQPHVEQLLWLHVQPDALVVDAKWKFLGGRPIDSIEILADDALTFLPSTARSLAGFSQARKQNKQVLRLQWDQPRTPPFEFQASFVMQGAAGVGAPAAPHLEIRDAVIAKRWLGVSLDPALEAESVETREVEPLSAMSFGAAWGEAPAPPGSAFRLLGAGAAWSAQTRFRDLPLTGRAALSIAYRGDAATVSYDAELDAGRGQVFILRLNTPKQFAAEQVSVTEGDVERVDHWSQDSEGELAVFLNGRVTGKHRLRVEGRIPTPPRGRQAAPLVTLSGAGTLDTEFRIYRGSDVALRVVQAQGLSPVADAPLGEHLQDAGRLAAAYSATLDGEAPPRLIVDVAPNRPRASQRQMATTLTPREDAWIVSTELDFRVNQGTIDVLRLEAPERMAGPFTVDPPGRLESREAPHLRRRILTYRPEQPLSGESRVRIRGFLRPAPGESLRAPNVELLELGETAQFFVLPLAWQGQPIAWDPYGMRADVLPPALEDSAPSSSYATYRVVNTPRYGAVIRQVEQRVGDPQVRLVDIHAVLHGENEFHATATIDLEPAGLKQCTLRLPSGAELVHASIEGLAVSPAQRDDGGYIFDLHGERLPMRLTVVYIGRVPAGATGEAVSIPAPVLVNLPVERTLWTVHRPGGGVQLAAEPSQRISASRQDLLRMRNIAGLVDLPADVEAEQSPEELARWYLPWSRRWFAVRRGAATGAAGGPSESLLPALDEEQKLLAQRYGAVALHERAEQEAARGAVPPSVEAVAGPSARAAVQGADEALTLLATSAEDAKLKVMWVIASLWLAASGLLVWLLRRHDAGEALARWFAPACVLAGVAWWLWLTPALAGVFIAGIGAWSSLRPGRKES